MENSIKNKLLYGVSSFAPSENNRVFAELHLADGTLVLSFEHLEKWSVLGEDVDQRKLVDFLGEIARKTEKIKEGRSSVFGKVTGTGHVVRYENNVPVTMIEEVHIAEKNKE